MTGEIFSFDIKGDKHIDKAISVAMSDKFRNGENIALTGYSIFEDEKPELRFYTGVSFKEGVTPFPCAINDPTDIIVQWLKDQEWSESGHYSDVMYHRGYRIFNVGLPYTTGIVFAVQPHWTEYHK